MGINEELKDIKELLETKGKQKEKKFKFPFSSRVSPRRAKKNWITLLKINENGNVDFSRKQINYQTIMENGIPRLALSQYVLYFKKNPMIILPSWSTKPFARDEESKKSLADGSNTVGYRILMDKMLSETTGTKKQISGLFKIILVLGLVGIVAYAIISGGGV